MLLYYHQIDVDIVAAVDELHVVVLSKQTKK
jgi:hypothetical protein